MEDEGVDLVFIYQSALKNRVSAYLIIYCQMIQSIRSVDSISISQMKYIILLRVFLPSVVIADPYTIESQLTKDRQSIRLH